jgi:hypothetical protein
VEEKHLHTAVSATVYRASAVVRKLHRQLSMSGIETLMKSSSVKPSRSSQGDGSSVWPRRWICWACICLVFSLKIIILLPISWVQIISKQSPYFLQCVVLKHCQLPLKLLLHICFSKCLWYAVFYQSRVPSQPSPPTVKPSHNGYLYISYIKQTCNV